jgi:hypothetical protein
MQTDVTSIEYFTSTFQVGAARNFASALFCPSTQRSVRSERCICAGGKARTPAAAGTKTLCGGELKDVAFICLYIVFCCSVLFSDQGTQSIMHSSAEQKFKWIIYIGTLHFLWQTFRPIARSWRTPPAARRPGAHFLKQKNQNKMPMDADAVSSDFSMPDVPVYFARLKSCGP